MDKASSSSPFSKGWLYDVFISFRGEDTRKNFTGHLYEALRRAGINAFIDDEELKKGEDLKTKFERAIQGSKISIIVFSRQYANSSWCLEELVKIMECRRTMWQLVLPIFYDVDPSHVRKQTDSFGQLFLEHIDEKKVERWKEERWRTALNEASNLSGWDLRNTLDGEIFKPPIVIKSGGGIHNYLYQLTSHGSTQGKVEGSNILGKLQITWRTNLGEPGRLQTQQIMGTPITRKDIELHVVEEPSAIKLERPFSLHLNLANETDKVLGPFEVCLSQDDSREENVVVINGLQTVVLPRVEAFSSKNFNLNLIATKLGIQRITGITVFNIKEKKSYDPLPDMEIFVDLD